MALLPGERLVRCLVGDDIEAYRRQYPNLGIMCGLDKRALAATRADVDREVEKAARMVRQGRYVPGFDHLIPPDATWDNVQYAAQRLKDVCYAGSAAVSSGGRRASTECTVS